MVVAVLMLLDGHKNAIPAALRSHSIELPRPDYSSTSLCVDTMPTAIERPSDTAGAAGSAGASCAVDPAAPTGAVDPADPAEWTDCAAETTAEEQVGVPEPLATVTEAAGPGDTDLLIVSGLSFDTHGHRLGQGKG